MRERRYHRVPFEKIGQGISMARRLRSSDMTRPGFYRLHWELHRHFRT
jgi:hypothetical protein